MKKSGSRRIVIPNSITPEKHEIEVVKILFKHFKCNIDFLIPSNAFKQKTPDIKMLGKLWEIKSPNGSSKNTIENNLRFAKAQSHNIILDIRRTKLSQKEIIAECKKQFKQHKSIKSLIIVDKEEKILDIKSL